ncbi:hypothetical protein P9112_002201 [Eukaryota sp. TZLM1-RC]
MKHSLLTPDTLHLDSEGRTVLKIENTSKKIVLFRVRTNNPSYVFSSFCDVIENQSIKEIQVRLKHTGGLHDKIKLDYIDITKKKKEVKIETMSRQELHSWCKKLMTNSKKHVQNLIIPIKVPSALKVPTELEVSRTSIVPMIPSVEKNFTESETKIYLQQRLQLVQTEKQQLEKNLNVVKASVENNQVRGNALFQQFLELDVQKDTLAKHAKELLTSIKTASDRMRRSLANKKRLTTEYKNLKIQLELLDLKLAQLESSKFTNFVYSSFAACLGIYCLFQLL